MIFVINSEVSITCPTECHKPKSTCASPSSPNALAAQTSRSCACYRIGGIAIDFRDSIAERPAIAVTVRLIARPRLEMAAHLILGYRLPCAACDCLGVKRIALIGSLTTTKAIPHDVDVLVAIDDAVDLDRFASAGRRLKGAGQNINLGADIFLADESGAYLGRICHYRECHPRAACRAQHCGRRDHLNDDLNVLTLPRELIARRRWNFGRR